MLATAWADTLREYVGDSNTRESTEEITDDVREAIGDSNTTEEITDDVRETKAASLPQFFKRKPNPTSEIGTNLAQATYNAFIADQRAKVLTNDELDVLWDALVSQSSGDTDDEKRIGYTDFEQIAPSLPEKYGPYFKPSTFMRFMDDEDGSISILQYFNYVLRKVSLMQARIDLGAYDGDYDGYLTENEIQSYIADLIPTLNLGTLNRSFQKFYLCTAARKFAFFLDPQMRGRVSIQNMLLSPILTELFELREPDLPEGYEKTNWFFTYSSLRVYGQFLNLDTNKNGMIGRQELSKYNGGSLTGVFLDRVFQERQTYKGEMDYRAFLDFVLAMENINTPEAIQYCFRMLDINNVGYLDENTVMYFFKGVSDKMLAMGHDSIGIRDVKNEIFDMANPETPHKITVADLCRCGVGGTIVKVLCDMQGFWAYETREVSDPSGGSSTGSS